MARLLEFCDGWMVPTIEPDFEAKNAELQARAKAAGREPLEVTLFGAGATHQLDEQAIERYGSAGVDRIIFNLPPSGAEVAVPELRRIGALVKQYA
jgi:hypothetical protein